MRVSSPECPETCKSSSSKALNPSSVRHSPFYVLLFVCLNVMLLGVTGDVYEGISKFLGERTS
jgi:hypothetical protein